MSDAITDNKYQISTDFIRSGARQNELEHKYDHLYWITGRKMFSLCNIRIKSRQEETAIPNTTQSLSSRGRLSPERKRTSPTPYSPHFWRPSVSEPAIIHAKPLELTQRDHTQVTSTGLQLHSAIRFTHHKIPFASHEKGHPHRSTPAWPSRDDTLLKDQHSHSQSRVTSRRSSAPSRGREQTHYIQSPHQSNQEATQSEVEIMEIHRQEMVVKEQVGKEANKKVRESRRNETSAKQVTERKVLEATEKQEAAKREEQEGREDEDSWRNREIQTLPKRGHDKRTPTIVDMQPSLEQSPSKRGKGEYELREPESEASFAKPLLESQQRGHFSQRMPPESSTHSHQEEAAQQQGREQGREQRLENVRRKSDVMSMLKGALKLKLPRGDGDLGRRARSTEFTPHDQRGSGQKSKNVLRRSEKKRSQASAFNSQKGSGAAANSISQSSPPTRESSSSSADIYTLSKLAMILEDKKLYKMFLSCPQSDAQTVLDVFQMLLDTRDMENYRRKQLITAMRRLSNVTELSPLHFNLRGPVQVLKDSPTNLGNYADVYKAQVQGEYLCLKVIRAYNNSLVKHMAKVYAREAITWGQLSHPNLLPFYGLYTFRSQIALVTPWAENGQLGDYLKQNPHSNRALLCLDAAAGLSYLHKHSIIHGDIRSTNVLVDSSGRACLADFGLSNVADPQIVHWAAVVSVASSKGGNTRWQAPEMHEPGLIDDAQPDQLAYDNKASDVFAWACLCYEAFTDQVPFFESRFPSSVVLKISRGYHPTKPDDKSPAWTELGLTTSIWSIMEDCWRFQPEERPSISAVIARLEPELPVDTRPPPQWEGEYAQRFRRLQSASFTRRQPTLEDLDAVLSRLLLN